MISRHPCIFRSPSIFRHRDILTYDEHLCKIIKNVCVRPRDHQIRNRRQKLCRMVPVSLKMVPYLARSWQTCEIIKKMLSGHLCIIRSTSIFRCRGILIYDEHLWKINKTVGFRPRGHQIRNRRQKLCRVVPVSLKMVPYLARSWQIVKYIHA